MKKGVTIGAIVIILFVILGVTFLGSNNNTTNANDVWKVTELTNVRDGETFTIQGLQAEGKPILIESFAVWCPTCTKQQSEIKKFHDEVGEDVISLSLDTDPNEDESRVLQHTNDNGFTWRYSVSPPDMTQSLIDEFGVGIVNAPSVPVVLICPNGDINKLGSGIKKVSDLKSAVASCGS